MKTECAKIEACLQILPKLNEILASNKFVATISDNVPVGELCRLPAGVTVEGLSREELDGFFNSNSFMNLNTKQSKPGIWLKASGAGSQEIIHILHLKSKGVKNIRTKKRSYQF